MTIITVVGEVSTGPDGTFVATIGPNAAPLALPVHICHHQPWLRRDRRAGRAERDQRA
jgi:hypothetical protein